MASPYDPSQSSLPSTPRAMGQGYLFGVPLGDLGWFSSLLMGLATGFAVFFLATFFAIVSILFWNAGGHHADYAASYKFVGLPAGVLAGLVALGYLAVQWGRRITRKA